METGKTFKFIKCMHLNEGKQNIHSDYLHVTLLRVKGQISKYVVWFITRAIFCDLKNLKK